MVRLAHPEYLYLLFLVAALGAAYWVFAKTRKKALSRFGNLNILDRLMETASGSKRLLKYGILLVAIAILIVGLANPEVGTRLEEVKQEGVDLFIALDVSLSMKAEDLKPNRLEKAKFEIRNLISRLAGDRVGLIVFAGDAFTQFPLTTDYGAANLFLDVVDTDVVPTPGTAIGSAIQRALESFSFDEPTTKVLIIITDGENTEGNALDAAREAAKKDVLMYTVGFGSSVGSPIPVYNAAGQQTDFKRDKQGNVVVTRLDEASLEEIASIGKGKYFRATNSQDELEEIYKSINALQKREFGVKQFTDYEQRFQYFIGAALILLIAEILLSDKKSRWIARWNPLKRQERVKT